MQSLSYISQIPSQLPNLSKESLDRPFNKSVYQVSTIGALLEGVYSSEISFSTLRRYGDFGIGTFNDLDGEAICLDGVFYQICSDGTINTVQKDWQTPFATVTFFQPDLISTVNCLDSFHTLELYLDSKLPSHNLLHAIRLDGEFTVVQARSVAKQVAPYRRLIDAVSEQQIFEFKKVEGTLVGFRFPSYMENINVPGYHFHFISADRQQGGHVMNVEIDYAVVQISSIPGFQMLLPEEKTFLQASLGHTNAKELEKIEK